MAITKIKKTKQKPQKPQKPQLTFHFVSLFPDAFTSYLGESIIKRAIEDGVLAAHFYNPRDFSDAALIATKEGRPSTYAERRVDDKPYAGGPGMVMEALPVMRAIDEALQTVDARLDPKKLKNVRIIFLYPEAAQFTTAHAEALAVSLSSAATTDTSATNARSTAKGGGGGHIVIVCGRYEGIDERAYEYAAKKYKKQTMRLSVGPFVLTGGELPAMIIMDAIARNIPGVLGNLDSLEQSRNASPAVYTRPESFVYKGKKLQVPKVLLSGDHAAIEAWRMSQKVKEKGE